MALISWNACKLPLFWRRLGLISGLMGMEQKLEADCESCVARTSGYATVMQLSVNMGQHSCRQMILQT